MPEYTPDERLTLATLALSCCLETLPKIIAADDIREARRMAEQLRCLIRNSYAIDRPRRSWPILVRVNGETAQ